MIRALMFSAVCLVTGTSVAQSASDYLHLINGVREVNIQEVGTNEIRYSYPGESAIYSINKNLVNRIEFAGGRSEEFTSPFKPVDSFYDAGNVYVTFNPDEVAGLDSKGDLFSKATGVTTLSSVNNVNNRAISKLKTEAAMLGANALLIGNQFQRGNQYGNEYTPGNSTMTTYSGMAYSTDKIDIQAAKEFIQNHQFRRFSTAKLNRNAWKPSIQADKAVDMNHMPILMDLGEVNEKDGAIYVKPKDIRIKTDGLRLIKITEDSIILMERTDKIIYNYYLLSDNHPMVEQQIKMANARSDR